MRSASCLYLLTELGLSIAIFDFGMAMNLMIMECARKKKEAQPVSWKNVKSE